jgi:acylphosphatase
MTAHYKIKVTGRVQGVWFRKYTQEVARTYGVTGFVANAPDGSVVLEAEGSREALEKLLDWLWRGSPLSKVEEVTQQEGKRVGFTDFEIRR